MARIVQYLDVALVPAQTAGVQNTTAGWRQQPLYPEAFTKPFPAEAQQFITHLDLQIATPFVASGPDRFSIERFAKPFPVEAQQFDAPFWRGNVPSPVAKEGYFNYELDYAFAKPFPVEAQQFDAPFWQGLTPSPVTPYGWWGQQLDYQFAKPFPVVEQLHVTHLDFKVPSPVFKDGWRGAQYDVSFVRPLSPAHQQFQATWRQDGKTTSIFPAGWQQTQQWDYSFAKPFPVVEQLYLTLDPELPPSSAGQPGWWGYQFDYAFARPFPVASQLFQAWPPELVLPFFPPGSGKRKDVPPGIPQPAWDKRPNKPFRPVWDRGPVKVEEPKGPIGPPPLPPASIFVRAADSAPQLDTFKLPSFDHLVPPNAGELGDKMRHAMDMSDVLAILKAMGVTLDEGET
jgi:hypothetical protein